MEVVAVDSPVAVSNSGAEPQVPKCGEQRVRRANSKKYMIATLDNPSYTTGLQLAAYLFDMCET